jgi:hypothetical protein
MRSVNQSVSRRSWRRIIKYLLLGATALFLVFTLTAWIVFEKKNQWLLQELQTSVNESLSGQVKIRSMELSLFKSFPGVTVVFDSITFYERYDSIRAVTEKPILYAEKLFIALDLISLMNDELNISEISLSDAEFTIVEYQQGVLNLDRALAPPVKIKPKIAVQNISPKPSSSSPVKKGAKPKPKTVSRQPAGKAQVDLENLELSNVTLNWRAYHSKMQSSIVVQDLETEFEKEGDLIIVNVALRSQVNALYVNRTSLPSGALNIQTDLQFNQKAKQLIIQDSEISFSGYTLLFTGTYDHLKNRKLDLTVDASSNGLKMISAILRPEAVKNNTTLRGDIYARGKVFGELTNQPLQFDLYFGVKELSLNLPQKLGKFQDIGFEGIFRSGNAVDYSHAVFELRNIRGQLPGGDIRGSVRISNFAEPHMNYRLNAQLKLDGFDQIFRIDFLKELKGSVSLNANFDGPLKSYATHEMDSNRFSTLVFQDISFVIAQSKKSITGLRGKIETKNNQSTIQQLTFQYGANDVAITATVDNLAYLLFNLENQITATGTFNAKQLFTNDFVPDTLSTALIQDRISNLSFDFDIKSIVQKHRDTLISQEILFAFKNLSAKLDKLPDLKSVTTTGKLYETSKGLTLSLESFHAVLPQGTADITGDLYIPSRRLWQLDAHVKLNKFPWTYVRELTAEIKDNQEPKAKNLPVEDMDLITAELDVYSSMITYPYDITRLEIKNCNLSYQLPNSKLIAVEKFDLSLENLLFNHPENSGIITGLKSTKGILAFRKLQLPGMKPFDISMEVSGTNDQLGVSFISEMQKAKSEHGTLDIDISKNEPAYHLRYFVEGANLEHFIKKYYNRKLMKGNLDYKIDLQTRGYGWSTIQKNITSNFEISGNSLRFYGVDIDNALKKYERSQNFNLTDLGAVLVAGPVGLVATKGTDFVALASVKLDSSKHTDIKTLYTRWKFEKEQLFTEDVAFATPKNRIAFNGQIDFQRDTIPGITIAVVDKNGCSLMDQDLYGKIGAVKTGKLNITKTLMGSVINFVNAVVGINCRPVYKGKVQAPVQ